MIDPHREVASAVSGVDSESVAVPGQVKLLLTDPGPQPLDVLSALTQMGCPPELATDYLGAAAAGKHPEVLVGASSSDAAKVAETLRAAGAAVSLGGLAEAPAAAAPQRSRFARAGVGATGSAVAAPAGASAPAPERHNTSVPGWQPAAVGTLEVDIVERYVAAYNAGDRASLVRCLSATAVLSDATGQVLVHGAQAIGRRMADVFEHYPDRQVTVLGRLIAKPWVLDHHRTTFDGGQSEETVLCFRVELGFIERLVLLR
jgi:hypothetical protein